MPCKTEIEDEESGVREPTFRLTVTHIKTSLQPHIRADSSSGQDSSSHHSKHRIVHIWLVIPGSHHRMAAFYSHNTTPQPKHDRPYVTKTVLIHHHHLGALQSTPHHACRVCIRPHNPAIYQDRKPDSPTEEGIKKEKKKKTRECRLQAAIQPFFFVPSSR